MADVAIRVKSLVVFIYERICRQRLCIFDNVRAKRIALSGVFR